MNFCDLMNKTLDLNGFKASLPTSVQWEYACRAGCSSALNNGTEITSKYGRCWNLGEVAWNPLDKVDSPQPVGKKVPNNWGIYDMHGNVWEWCLDWYEDNITTYGGAVNIDPAAPAKTLSGASGANRVVRGGCCILVASHSRPGNRDSFSPKDRNGSFGFRVMCTTGLR